MDELISKDLRPDETPVWVRRPGGWFMGVFEGIGHGLQINPNVLRFIWLLSFFGFGFGLLIYLILAFTTPVYNELYSYRRPKFLGACYKVSNQFQIELGLVRSLFVFSLFCSLGLSLVLYLAAFLLLDDSGR